MEECNKIFYSYKETSAPVLSSPDIEDISFKQMLVTVVLAQS